MTVNSNFIINNSNALQGDLTIPGDKSVTHRAIILSSLSNGNSKIFNGLQSEDCKKTISAFESLGVKINIKDDFIEVFGAGLNSLKKPKSVLDAGNSGTLIRLLSGILATQNFESSISGDESLSTRPMERIIKPLTLMGANITSNNNKAPLLFKPSKNLKVINYSSRIPSAQVKSCIILASLFISGISIIRETIQTRDHTEQLLKYLEYPIEIKSNEITISGQKELSAKDIFVPSDISSASFFIVAALIKENSNILLKNIGINPLRTGIIDVLIEMGADIKILNKSFKGSELIGDINVKYSQLKPIKISGSIVSRLIDEFPILFIACATCKGVSEITDIEELRHKESDRIRAMEVGLKKLGIIVSSTLNSITIKGGNFNGGIVDSFGDHRIAMSFIIAGLVSRKPITVTNTDNINTSFPNFFSILRKQKAELFKI
tara:strand:+ start:153 stop:1457 length:1305 start_codon:yes stop_codon:yes gene_type:complete